jgi:hypothetical protein
VRRGRGKSEQCGERMMSRGKEEGEQRKRVMKRRGREKS